MTNNGQGVQSLQLVDTRTNVVTQTISYASPESLYVGLAWSPDGRTAYASAAANSKVRVFAFADGKLTESTPLALATTSPDGAKVTLFPAGLAVTPDGGRLIVADQLGNAVTSIDLASKATQTIAAGPRPLWVTLSKGGRTAYVANQGGSTVDVVDISKAAPVISGHVAVGLHPNKSVLSADGLTLYVANGDADSVSEVRLSSGTVTRTLSLQPYQKAPVGSNPTGLALDDAGRRFFVTNSGNNDVAVIDLGECAVTGLIPTAWYPSSVAFHDGRLIVTNAKGLGAGPNTGPGQPNPTDPNPKDPQRYTGSMIEGTLSILDVPGRAALARYTSLVRRNNAPVRSRRSVVPLRAGAKGPVKHVIYVVKRTAPTTSCSETWARETGIRASTCSVTSPHRTPVSLPAVSPRSTTSTQTPRSARTAGTGWPRQTPTRMPSRCGRPTTRAEKRPTPARTPNRRTRHRPRTSPTCGSGSPRHHLPRTTGRALDEELQVV